jgi:CRP-like cAMP-binding protein
MEPIPTHGVAAFRPGQVGETRSIPMQLLSAQAIFQDLDPATLDAVSKMMRSFDVATGDFVFRQGTEPDGLYLLESGEMLMWSKVFDARKDIVRFQSGAPLCMASLVEAGGRVTSMEALAPSRVWVLEMKSFESLREQLHPVAFRLLRAATPELGRSFSRVLAHFRGQVGLAPDGKSARGAPLPEGRALTAADLPQLKVLPFVKGLVARELEGLLEVGQWRELPRGHRLLGEDDVTDEMHLVVRGALEAFLESGGQKKRLSARGPGRWAGNHVLLSGEPSGLCVAVKETAAVLSISRHALEGLYARQHPLGLRLLEQMSTASAQDFNIDLPTLMRTSDTPVVVASVGPDGQPVIKS